MTIEQLSNLGADTKSAIARCAGNEALFLRLVPKALEESKYLELEQYILEKKYDEAFEVAHALKGVLANMSLTPILNPVCEIVELLRAKTDTDYSALLEEVKTQRDKFASL
jgi:HPt (histidine-containing phosphotransfer) domain-containing protein